MADQIQFNGKTYVPLDEAAALARIEAGRVRALAGEGKVLLRAVGKKIYVDLDGLRTALRPAPKPAPSAPLAVPPVMTVMRMSPPPPVAEKPVPAPQAPPPLPPSPPPPAAQKPVPEPSAVPPPVVAPAPPPVARPAQQPAPMPVPRAETPARPVRVRVSSAELAALSMPPAVEPVRAPSTAPASTPPPPTSALKGVVVPPQGMLTPQRSTSFATSAAAVAAFVFVLGSALFAWERAVPAFQWAARTGESVAAALAPSVAYDSDTYAAQGEAGTVVLGQPEGGQSPASYPSAATSTVQPIYYVYNYPVIERVREEFHTIDTSDPSTFSAQLAALYERIQGQIQSLNIQTNTNFAQQYQVIAHSNRIDNLGTVTITNSIFDGGTIRNTTLEDVTVSADDISGVVSVSSGGLGTSSPPTSGQVLLGNAAGGYDLVATSSLGIVGTILFTELTDTPDSLELGDILYANGADTLGRLPIGSAGQVLKVSGGVPVWSSDLVGAGAGGAAIFATSSDDLLIQQVDPTQVLVIGASATTTTGNILEVDGDVLFNDGLVVSRATTTGLSVSGTASTSALVASNSFTFSTVSGILKATAGAVAAALVDLASDVTGVLSVASGGTGWSNIQSGALLFGNGSGALATSSALSFDGTKLAATYASSTALTISGTAYAGTLQASALQGAGLATCESGSFLTWSGGTFGCDTDSVAAPGSGIVSLNGLEVASQTFATSSDDNLLLTITSSGSTHTFTPSWSGFLSVARGGTGTSTAPAAGALLIGNGTGYDFISSTDLAESLNYWQTDGTNVWRSAGNVGIGDSSPSQILDIDGTNAQILIEESTTEFFRAGVGETSNTSVIGWDDSDSLLLGVYSSPTDTTITPHVTITSTGNVGVGVTTPLGRVAVSSAGLSQTWAQVGNGTSIVQPFSNNLSLAALSPTRVAYIDSFNSSLRMYEYTGSGWVLVGSGLTISGNLTSALAGLTPNRVAYVDTGNDQLRMYEFATSSWSQVGSGLSISSMGSPALAALTPNRVAFIDVTNDELRTYEFNGSSWSQVGNGLSISNVALLAAIGGLSPNRVAFIDGNNDLLRTYEFNGTTWAEIGTALSVSASHTIPEMAVLSPNRIAIYDGGTNALATYEFNGDTWRQTGSMSLITTTDYGITGLTPNRVAFVDANNTTLRMYQFSSPLLYVSDDGDYPFFGVSDIGQAFAEALSVRTDLRVGQSATSTAGTSSPALTVWGNATFSSGIGIGTTTPWANLAIVGLAAQSSPLFHIASSSQATSFFTVAAGGNVGVGSTTPWHKLSVVDTVSSPQFALSYDTTRTAQLRVDSTGDLHIGPSGGDVYLNDDNFWVCAGGSVDTGGCPVGAPSGTGNILVENKLGVAGTTTPWGAISVGADAAIVTTEKSLVDGGTIAVNWLEGNQQKVTLGGNRTITFSNYIPGQTLRLIVCQDSGGSRTVTWPDSSILLWPAGTAPTLTTTGNRCDVLAFVATGATSTVKIFGSSVLNF